MKKLVLILTMLFVSSGMVSSQSVPGLQAIRQIEYTVDEGTWISLDVSPDGQSIVFELVGDLYTLPKTLVCKMNLTLSILTTQTFLPHILA